MNTDTTISQPAQGEDQDYLRALLEHSSDCIYFKDRESRFRRCSKAMCERFSISFDAVVGKTDYDFFDEAHAGRAYADEQEILRSGRPIHGKVEHEIMKDGSEKWALTSKMPLRNQHGEVTGTFGISKDITALKQAEAKLAQLHGQLMESSRAEGMAEVATTVLHNVGNVLNSVNISATIVAEKVRTSRAGSLSKAADLLQQQNGTLADFLTNDARGRQFPAFLTTLARHVQSEQQDILRELSSLCANIEHIKEIVAMQQAYAKVSGIQEWLRPQDLVEDALRLNAGAVERHNVKVIREFGACPAVLVDKHKVLQILVNLIRNAKYALDERGHSDKRLIVRTGVQTPSAVQISIIDNGVGIPPENKVRIFEHGFTTRADGHGFGLHSGALAARQLGGSLTCQSDGPDQGASFILELPLATENSQ